MKYLTSILLLVGFLPLSAQEIVINTNNTTLLVLRVDKDKRVYQTHLGKRLVHENEYALLPQMGEVGTFSGDYLMTVGIKAFSEHRLQSRIFSVEE